MADEKVKVASEHIWEDVPVEGTDRTYKRLAVAKGHVIPAGLQGARGRSVAADEAGVTPAPIAGVEVDEKAVREAGVEDKARRPARGKRS